MAHEHSNFPSIPPGHKLIIRTTRRGEEYMIRKDPYYGSEVGEAGCLKFLVGILILAAIIGYAVIA